MRASQTFLIEKDDKLGLINKINVMVLGEQQGGFEKNRSMSPEVRSFADATGFHCIIRIGYWLDR